MRCFCFRLFSWPFLSPVSLHGPSRSLELKDIALHNTMHDAPDAVTRRGGIRQDLVHVLSISEADEGARRVRSQLADKIPCHGLLVVLEQQALELADVFVGTSIGECAGGIYGQPVVERVALT